MKLRFLLFGFAAASLLSFPALAQVTLPEVSSVTTGDLVQVIPNGVPTAQSKFADMSVIKTYTNNGNVATDGSVLSSSPSGGVGYTTGAGCAVEQASSRTTGVTCTGVTGAITLVSAAGSATPATFTVTDTSVAATDTIIINEKSGTDLYHTLVTAVGAGSFNVTFFTTGGTTTEQPVFNFAVIKGAAS